MLKTVQGYVDRISENLARKRMESRGEDLVCIFGDQCEEKYRCGVCEYCPDICLKNTNEEIIKMKKNFAIMKILVLDSIERRKQQIPVKKERRKNAEVV